MFRWLFQKKEAKKENPSSRRTLYDVDTGESVHIQSLKGNLEECQRLREMGFCENATVEKVMENKALICKVCNTKVIISQGLAKNILVKEDSTQTGGSMPEPEKRIILLSELSEGQKGHIHNFVMENDACARLEEMGVTPGEAVEIIRYAPLGDPIEIYIRGYNLSLRKEEADLIQVTV